MQAQHLHPLEVLEKVKSQLKARGSHTIRSLGRMFRHMDSYDRNHKVDYEEFKSGLTDIGVIATADEFFNLHKLLDTDGDGRVNFTEFLIGVRGSLNERRQRIVDKAFLKFDKDCSGFISPEDLKGVYTTSAHPKVQRGEMTEEEVFLTFLQSFGDVDGSGTITREEWNDYYAAVSSNIDNDDHFVQLMITAWKLNE